MIIRSKLLQILCLVGCLVATYSLKAAIPATVSITPADEVCKLSLQAQLSASDLEIKKMELVREKLVQELAKKGLTGTTADEVCKLSLQAQLSANDLEIKKMELVKEKLMQELADTI